VIYYVTGTPVNVTLGRVYEAVDFACNALGLTVETLEVVFSPLPTGACGYADYEEEESHAEIEVSRDLSENETIRTIFHELVHVCQYDRGWLQVGYPQLWNGKPVNDIYSHREHEQEAYSLELFLYEDFTNVRRQVFL
tara:strand:- start:271 stop:684 length:414 start_codon:yes stop_codon:yes gene_type:complete